MNNNRRTILLKYPSVCCDVQPCGCARCIQGGTGVDISSVQSDYQSVTSTISVLPRGSGCQLPAIVFNSGEKLVITEENNNNKRMSRHAAFLTHHHSRQL